MVLTNNLKAKDWLGPIACTINELLMLLLYLTATVVSTQS